MELVEEIRKRISEIMIKEGKFPIHIVKEIGISYPTFWKFMNYQPVSITTLNKLYTYMEKSNGHKIT